MVFADDERKANPTGFKFLQMAHAWKESQAKNSAGAIAIAAATQDGNRMTEDVEMSDAGKEGSDGESDSGSDKE
jgi:crooked neck